MTTPRKLNFAITLYIANETEAVRVADSWLLAMRRATEEWGKRGGYRQRPNEEEARVSD